MGQGLSACIGWSGLLCQVPETSQVEVSPCFESDDDEERKHHKNPTLLACHHNTAVLYDAAFSRVEVTQGTILDRGKKTFVIGSMFPAAIALCGDLILLAFHLPFRTLLKCWNTEGVLLAQKIVPGVLATSIALNLHCDKVDVILVDSEKLVHVNFALDMRLEPVLASSRPLTCTAQVVWPNSAQYMWLVEDDNQLKVSQMAPTGFVVNSFVLRGAHKLNACHGAIAALGKFIALLTTEKILIVNTDEGLIWKEYAHNKDVASVAFLQANLVVLKAGRLIVLENLENLPLY